LLAFEGQEAQSLRKVFGLRLVPPIMRQISQFATGEPHRAAPMRPRSGAGAQAPRRGKWAGV